MKWKCALLLFALALPLAAQQPRAAESNDIVTFRDRDGGTATRAGEIKESPAGLVITSGGKSITISPADVISVQYGRLAGVDDKIRQELPLWDTRGGPDLPDKYADLLRAAGTAADERTRRFCEFKSAMAAARLADAKTGDDFPPAAAAAIDKLSTAARSWSKSWEVWPLARAMARLQLELGKPADAAASFALLAKADGVPADLKADAQLCEIELLFRTGAAQASAAAALDAVEKKTTLTEPQKLRLSLVKLAVQGARDKADAAKVHAAAAAMRDILDRLDPPARPAAHNLLGELFLQASLPHDAQWEFLWVAAVHNKDRDEELKALARLVEVFEARGEKDRADAFRDRRAKARTP